MLHGKYREKIPRYSVVPWLYFNFNDTILCLIIAIFNSSGIKYVLAPIIDVTTTFGSIHLASMRITNVWNSLYRSLSLLPFCRPTRLRIDWINTGHHKNLDTIGKQNYQEPGVEAELNFEFCEFYHYMF